MTQGRSRKARKKLRARIRWLSTRATAMPSTNLMATMTPLHGVLRVDLAEDVERFDEGFVARPVVDDEPLEHPRDRRVGVLLAPRVVEDVRIALGLAAKRQVDQALHERLLLPHVEPEVRLEHRTPLADAVLAVHLARLHRVPQELLREVRDLRVLHDRA